MGTAERGGAMPTNWLFCCFGGGQKPLEVILHAPSDTIPQMPTFGLRFPLSGRLAG